jgi:hypothetical protein
VSRKVEMHVRDRHAFGGCFDDPPEESRVVEALLMDVRDTNIALGMRLVRRRSALEWLAESLREVSDGQEEEG